MLYIVMKKWTFLETSVEFLKVWSKSLFLEINIWQRFVPCFARASRDPVASPVRFHVPWPPYAPGYALHPPPSNHFIHGFFLILWPTWRWKSTIWSPQAQWGTCLQVICIPTQIACSTVEPLNLWIPLIISSSYALIIDPIHKWRLFYFCSVIVQISLPNIALEQEFFSI